MRIVKVSALALGTLVFVGLAGTLSAQNNGNPSILAAVQAVGATVNSIVTSLASLTTSINTLNTTVNTINASTGVGNTLFTPSLVGFAPDTLICSVTNVSSAPRSVTLQLLNANGGAVLASSSGSLDPGTTTNASILTGVAGTRGICRILVSNGVKSDVRGVLALYAAANASDKDPVAAY